jgi:hypothetical protein
MRSSSLRFALRMLLVTVLYAGVASHAVAKGYGGGGSSTGGDGGGGGATSHGPAAPAGPTGPGGGGNGTHTFTGATGDPDAIGAVQSASQAADAAIGLCDPGSRGCIASALDDLATALLALAPQLPPEFHDLPIIVERAATKVRTARTKKEAIAAVTTAIAAVHKSIALLKADDPVALRAETRAGSFVIQTLQVADDKLQKAVGL